MSLQHYQHYWNQARGLGEKARRRRMAAIRESAGIQSGFGGSSDPLGAQTPMVQDSMLGELRRRAAGNIDDWESLIDPTLSYEENLATLQRKGAGELESERDRKRQKHIQSADDRSQRRAKRVIRDNIDEIEAGQKDRLTADIAEEFGQSFVTAAIEEAKVLESPATAGAPDPTQPAETPSPAPTGPETAVSDKYTGILGAIRLFLAVVVYSALSRLQSAADTVRTARLIIELEARQKIREHRPLAATAKTYAAWYRLRLTNDRPTTN